MEGNTKNDLTTKDGQFIEFRRRGFLDATRKHAAHQFVDGADGAALQTRIVKVIDETLTKLTQQQSQSQFQSREALVLLLSDAVEASVMLPLKRDLGSFLARESVSSFIQEKLRSLHTPQTATLANSAIKPDANLQNMSDPSPQNRERIDDINNTASLSVNGFTQSSLIDESAAQKRKNDYESETNKGSIPFVYSELLDGCTDADNHGSVISKRRNVSIETVNDGKPEFTMINSQPDLLYSNRSSNESNSKAKNLIENEKLDIVRQTPEMEHGVLSISSLTYHASQSMPQIFSAMKNSLFTPRVEKEGHDVMKIAESGELLDTTKQFGKDTVSENTTIATAISEPNLEHKLSLSKEKSSLATKSEEGEESRGANIKESNPQTIINQPTNFTNIDSKINKLKQISKKSSTTANSPAYEEKSSNSPKYASSSSATANPHNNDTQKLAASSSKMTMPTTKLKDSKKPGRADTDEKLAGLKTKTAEQQQQKSSTSLVGASVAAGKKPSGSIIDEPNSAGVDVNVAKNSDRGVIRCCHVVRGAFTTLENAFTCKEKMSKNINVEKNGVTAIERSDLLIVHFF
ncbi:hypothetical protein HK100_001750 [Physocladia obscura]|uniref:Uncharacterized protein n=1 Tax=Physocladia obscura TaxID=109957 RepID=A0AAD5XHB0_9FUNG|nr:hypothetical protein HK100_001750 [Physocladia obscura]